MTITESSKEAYSKTISKIKKDLDSDDDIFKDYKKVIEYIDNKEVSYLTKRNYYNSIIVYTKDKINNDILKKYQDKRDILNKQYEDNAGEKSEKTQKNWTDLNSIIKVKEELKKEVQKIMNKNNLINKNKNKIQILFILTFHLNNPIRNDLSNSYYIDYNDYIKLDEDIKNTNNYFVYGKKNFYSLANYKTNKTYGLKIIDINEEILSIFHIWLKHNPTTDNSLLVNLKDNSNMTSHNLTLLLTSFFKRTLNKSIGSTLLRSIILTELFSENKEKQKKYADICCHDISTQQNIYVKN